MHFPNFISLSATLLAAGGAVASPTPTNEQLNKRDSWGGSVSLGPAKTHIINAVTTIIPGAAPPKQNGVLFLWPGMSNGTGDLIQSTLEDWQDNSWCGAKSGQWCVRASIFGWFGQLDGPAAVVNGNDHVKIEYKLAKPDANGGGNWVQNVTNAQTGAYLSSYERVSGNMRGWGTGTECNDGCTGTIAAQQYLNTIITLDAADTTFGSTISTAQGATYTGLSSSQGGKVWTIKEMNIPKMG